MNKLIKISSFFIILIIIFSLISGCTDSNNEKHILDDGGEEFTFLDINGIENNLSDFRGKIVILDMWATWCSPCEYQMWELEKLYNYYDQESITIISLDVDPDETVGMVKDYINDEFQKYGMNLNWVFGLDTHNIWEKYKINGGIPTLYIFDQNGKIYYTHEGVSVFSEIPSGWPNNTVKLKEKIDELIL